MHDSSRRLKWYEILTPKPKKHLVNNFNQLCTTTSANNTNGEQYQQ